MGTLFVISGVNDSETLSDFVNAAITSAIMGLEVNVLFMGSSVKCLIDSQVPDDNKKPTEILEQLISYGVHQIFAEETHLKNQLPDITGAPLTIPITRLKTEQLKSLFIHSDKVLNF